MWKFSCIKKIICNISDHEESHSGSWIQGQFSGRDFCGEAANTPCTCHQISDGVWLGFSDRDCPWTVWGIYHTVSDRPADHHHAHGPKSLSISSCPLAPVQTLKCPGPRTVVMISVPFRPWKRDQAWAPCLLPSFISTWTNYQLIS